MFIHTVPKIYNIIRNNWQILVNSPETSALFSEGTLLSQRRNKNLRDLLTRSTLEVETELGGTFPCGRNRCKTCDHTCQSSSIEGPDGIWKINHSFTCTSKNLVYCITCSVCGMLYIGETKRMLAERFREHRNDVLKNNRKCPVAIHFNTPGHSVDDLQISGMVECYGDKERKTTEMRMIFKLGTLDPKGINFDFSFNV